MITNMNDTEEVEGFISFLSDYGFKATFGNESDTRFLRKALQALIGSSIPIMHVEFLKNELSSITSDSRGGIYDLACVDAENRHFIVEMQANDYPQFMQRMKFYAFHKFNTMVKRGKYFFTGLEPIYCIGILAHNIFPFEEKHNFGTVQNQHGQIMDDQITYITYELDKFNLPISEVKTDLEKLIYTMKYLQTYTKKAPTQFPDFWTEDWLDFAIKELDTRQFTPEQYMYYVMTLAKNAAAVENENKKVIAAKAEGISLGKAEGISLGKAEGISLGKAEGIAFTKSVFKLHLQGLTAAAIAAKLGADIKTIMSLLAE